MTDTERQELYTLMQQWGRNDDIRYQKVREWVEAKFDPLQLERDALREALQRAITHHRNICPAGRICLQDEEALLSLPASGEPARKP